MKYFAITINLNGELEQLARKGQQLLKKHLSIKFISTNSLSKERVNDLKNFTMNSNN